MIKLYKVDKKKSGKLMKTNKNNTCYQRITDLREDADKTQAEVAKDLNMHITQYRRYEKAETPVTADFIVKIAKYYNVSANYILGLTNKITKIGDDNK